MNEELKIIIKAVVDEANKNLKEVKKALKDIDAAGDKSGKTMGAAMKGIAKSVAVAVGSVAALTAAMAKLGQAAQDVEKGFAKLNTTFKNAGSSAAQANKTYKDLFGFLGEHDKAIETAQSLALITTEEEKLAEWTNILQGAYAEMGDKLPTEGLAEAANETINVGKAAGVLVDALTWMGISEDGFNAALEQTTNLEEREALTRNILNGLYANAAQIYAATNQATIQYNQSQADLNIALASAAGYTTPLLTALNNLGSTLLSVFGPALRTVSIYLTGFIQLLAEAIAWVGSFFGIFSSKSEKTTADVAGYKAAMANYTNALSNMFNKSGDGIDNNINKVKELKKQTMGFDELNVVSNPVSAASGSGAGAGVGKIDLSNMPVAPNPEDFGIGTVDVDFSEFQKDLDEAKEKITGFLTLAGIVGGVFATWKLIDFVKDLTTAWKTFKDMNISFKAFQEMSKRGFLVGENAAAAEFLNKIKIIGGYLLIVAGTMLTINGYTDAWANGVSLGNLATTLAGMAAIVGGLYLAFGPLAAIIGTVAAGIALLVLGVKDFIANGPTWQNTILIIGGAIAVAVALATGGVSVLISAIIGAVAAIGAFIAAIVLEEPAIKSVEEAQLALNQAKEAAAAAENDYISAVDAADAALDRLKAAEEAAGESGAALFEKVQSGALDYADLTDKQKELYKAYKNNEEKQKDLEESTKTLTDARKAETIASFENDLALAKESGSYEEYKNSVIAAFEEGTLSAEEARELLEKSMSEMSNDAQQTFMEDIPGSIRDGMNPHEYESTGTKLKKWFGDRWTDIKKVFSDAGTFFKGVGSKIAEAVGNGVKTAINGIITFIENKINSAIGLINGAIGLINKIPGVSVGTISKLSLPRLAEGGIVGSATVAMIGEAGKEAVLPLENNTEWMDRLADRIAARSSTPTKIILKVGERELGEATIQSINGIIQQTGNIPLVFV